MRPLAPILEGVRFNSDGSFADLSAAKRMLDFMVSHNTGSSYDPKLCQTNVPFVKALKGELERLGLTTLYAEEEFPPNSGIKHATLVARMGKPSKGGVVLSSHTDVIPVSPDDEAKWDTPPFQLSETACGLTARGAVDMKQAIVNYMAIAKMYVGKHDMLKEPVYIALSWGEEIGCKGVPTVNRLLHEMHADPKLIIVGEPTGEDLVLGHKGGANIEININTIGGHSSAPRRWISASKYSHILENKLVALQKRYEKQPQYQDPAFDPPYPIVNIGRIEVGVAGSYNSAPSSGMLGLHIRSTGKVSLNEIMGDIRHIVYEQDQHLKNESRDRAGRLAVPVAGVGITYRQLSESKALPMQKDEAMLGIIRNGLSELGMPGVKGCTVSYAADAGGLADSFPGSTTVIFGTGSLSQNAHAPREYIEPEQLRRGPMFPLKMISEICLDRTAARSNPEPWMIPMAASLVQQPPREVAAS